MEITPTDQSHHGVLFGSTGSGKTTTFHHLIANNIVRGHSFGVIDPLGDLVNDTLELLVGHIDPSRVELLDLRERSRPSGFDPLRGSSDVFFRSQNTYDAIFRESDSWGVQLAEGMQLALFALAEAGHPLTDLEPLFYDATLRMRVLQNSTNQAVIDYFTRFEALSNEKKQAHAQPILNKTSRTTSVPGIRQVLAHTNPIDLGKHLNTPGSVFLCSLAKDRYHSASSVFGAMLLSAITREIFARVEVAASKRVPFNLFVDEFAQFSDYEFESILVQGRRFGLSLTVGLQSTDQLTPHMRTMLLGNAGLKIFLKSGRDEGALLSKDLFGNANAFDFTALPSGCAVIARRGKETTLVDVNAPLLESGAVSAAGRAFRNAILSRNPATPDDTPIRIFRSASEAQGEETPPRAPEWKSGPIVEPGAAPKVKAPVHAPVAVPSPLEDDWLCG